MKFLLIAILMFLGKYFEVLGAKEFLQITSDDSCFDEMSDVVLEVKYSGSGTPAILKWKFSKMLNPSNVLNILTSYCIASSGADPNFPVDRINYSCDNAIKQYTLTINSFNETSDSGIWEAAVSVGESFTDFTSFAVEKCSG